MQYYLRWHLPLYRLLSFPNEGLLRYCSNATDLAFTPLQRFTKVSVQGAMTCPSKRVFFIAKRGLQRYCINATENTIARPSNNEIQQLSFFRLLPNASSPFHLLTIILNCIHKIKYSQINYILNSHRYEEKIIKMILVRMTLPLGYFFHLCESVLLSVATCPK